MPVKTSKIVLVLAMAVFMLSGGCKDNITTSDAYSKPIIWLNAFEMTFSASEFGPNPTDQVLKIKNTGQGTLDYTIEDDANFYNVDWLRVSPSSGDSEGEVEEHIVSVEKTGLEARDKPYTAKITITSNDAYNTPQRVDVSLTLSEEAPPQIGVSPKTLSFFATVGGSDPASKTISIGNTGESTLNYAITWDADWLDVAPASGTSDGGQNIHTVSVDAGGLGQGAYSGTITISDPNATNNPQSVAVSLEIGEEAPPEIWVSTSQLAFSATAGGSNPSSQTFQVRNSGEGILNYQINWDENWMSVSPDSGTSGGASRTHRVSIDTGGLGDGTYRGTITVSDPNAGNDPQEIGLTLRITSQPPPSTDNDITLSVSPTSGTYGTIVTVTIGVRGNMQPISAFGMDLTYDGAMFQFVDSTKGTLTGSWGLVSANSPSSGLVRVGGAAFGGAAIPVGSTGSIIIVRLRVTGGSLSDGAQSLIRVLNFTDDIVGMGNPGARTFTLRK
jgi:hypothetical protein